MLINKMNKSVTKVILRQYCEKRLCLRWIVPIRRSWVHWKNEYSLGILEIDNQHKSLIHCFASIEASIKAGHTWSSTHFNIVSLKEVARFHFSCEEALMRLFGYPDIEEHSSQHEHFFTFLAEIENNSLH